MSLPFTRRPCHCRQAHAGFPLKGIIGPIPLELGKKSFLSVAIRAYG
jgi:hypothetical protein